MAKAPSLLDQRGGLVVAAFLTRLLGGWVGRGIEAVDESAKPSASCFSRTGRTW